MMKYMVKDMVIAKLKEINEKAVSGHEGQRVITRLYYTSMDGTRQFVEDFTPYTTGDYFTEELKNALANGTTLTTKQQLELNQFVIEGTLE